MRLERLFVGALTVASLGYCSSVTNESGCVDPPRFSNSQMAYFCKNTDDNLVVQTRYSNPVVMPLGCDDQIHRHTADELVITRRADGGYIIRTIVDLNTGTMQTEVEQVPEVYNRSICDK